MYIFKEIKINRSVAIRNYSESDNRHIKLNTWGIWVKMAPTSNNMTKEEKIALSKITTRCQGVVPEELIPGIIKKYGCAKITQSKSNRSVNILQKYKHGARIDFNFKEYLYDRSIYTEPEATNMFDIDTSKLPKTKLGIPILP